MTNPIFGDLSNAISSYPINAPISAYGYRAPNYDSLYTLAQRIQAASQKKFLDDLKTSKSNREAQEVKNSYIVAQGLQDTYNLEQQMAGDTGVNDIYKQMGKQGVPINRIQDFISGYSTNAVQGVKFVGGLGSVDPSLYKPIEKKYQGDINSATISKLQQIQGNEGKLRETSSEEIKKKDTIAGILSEAKGLENTISVLKEQYNSPYATTAEKKDIMSQWISASNEYEKKMNSIGRVQMGKDINYTTELPSPSPSPSPPPPENKSDIIKDFSDVINYSPEGGTDFKNNQVFSGLKSVVDKGINELNPNSPITPLNTVRNLNPATLPLGMLIQAYQSMPKAVRDKIIPPKTRA